MNLVVLVPLACLIVWEGVEVQRYSRHWPSSLWTGEFVSGMTRTCQNVFLTLRCTCVIFAVSFIVDLFILIVMNMPLVRVCCRPLAIGFKVLEFMASGVRLVCCIWGLIVIGEAVPNARQECRSLDTCSWTVFVGFLALTLLSNTLRFCCQVLTAAENRDFPAEHRYFPEHKAPGAERAKETHS